MNIFIYSDESGVFDNIHNDFFVFGGLVFLSKESRDICSRKYISIEKLIRNNANLSNNIEIKATSISNKHKGKLFKSLNSFEKFGVIINQKKIHEKIFKNKKHKQRYLDFAYKIAIKRKFEFLIKNKQINPYDIEGLYFYIDEHQTATDARYELRESMLQEFKEGMFTSDYRSFKDPIFPNLKHLEVKFCNSKKNSLVRAADMVSNKLYYSIIHNKDISIDNFYFIYLP